MLSYHLEWELVLVGEMDSLLQVGNELDDFQPNFESSTLFKWTTIVFPSSSF